MARHQVREIGGVRVGMQASKIKFHKCYAVYHPDHPDDIEHLQTVRVVSITTIRTEDGPGGISEQTVSGYYSHDSDLSGPWEGHPNDLLGEPEQFESIVRRNAAKRQAEQDKRKANQDRAVTAIKMLQSVGLKPRYRIGRSFRQRRSMPDAFEFDTPERIQGLIDFLQQHDVAVPSDLTLEEEEED